MDTVENNDIDLTNKEIALIIISLWDKQNEMKGSTYRSFNKNVYERNKKQFEGLLSKLETIQLNQMKKGFFNYVLRSL